MSMGRVIEVSVIMRRAIAMPTIVMPVIVTKVRRNACDRNEGQIRDWYLSASISSSTILAVSPRWAAVAT